jgi:hypothetical protein
VQGIHQEFVAFEGTKLLTRGHLEEVVTLAKARIDQGTEQRVAIFDDSTARILDFDFRGDVDEVLARLDAHPLLDQEDRRRVPKAGPGRPKLGVVSKEVTLLPRHWQWLARQKGGASATLRRLVEEARRNGGEQEAMRRAQEAVHRFLWDMTSDFPDFEEATRAFFAGQYDRFFQLIAHWPQDIQDHLKRMVNRIGEDTERS